FDCEIGQPVAPHSVHGQFIAQIFGGDQKRFEKETDEALSTYMPTATAREHPRSNSYAIGTTAVLHIADRCAFLFALAKTDPQTHKASSSVSMMLEALAGLWKSVRNNSGGRVVNLPLAGGGQSGLGFIGPSELLRVILLSAFIASKEGEITKRI